MNTLVLPAPRVTAAGLPPATPATPAPATGPWPGTVLSLSLAGQAFAIDIACVREIRSFEPPTPLPGAAAGVLGVINLRGTIVPVIDLRCRLGLPARAGGAGSAVVVVEQPSRLDGVVVDAVDDVLEIAPSQWRPVPPLGLLSMRQAHLRALASVDQRLVQLLDMAALLRDPTTCAMPSAPC
jgi:purine-binding chemotaxis protein CheW